MPCIFCVCVFLALAGTVTAATIDQMEARLEGQTTTPVKRVVDTASVAKLEFSMAAAGTTVPVAITVMKDAKRVRIQLLSHDLSPQDSIALQDRIAKLLELEVVDRSDPEAEGKVREAFDHSHAHKDLAEPPQRRTRPLRAGPDPG